MFDLTIIRFTNDDVINDLLTVLDRIAMYLPT
jgi:very-short-patch-repair endonuclease